MRGSRDAILSDNRQPAYLSASRSSEDEEEGEAEWMNEWIGTRERQ